MKANIVIRQPVNLGSREALDLIQGDKIVCRRCGEGEVRVLKTPTWGDPIEPDQFAFHACDPMKPGTEADVKCWCGGLLIYSQPVGRWF